MLDGIYSIAFRGRADWGMGMLLLQQGKILGADSGGVQYDGKYVENISDVKIELTMTVPPGATLVQGTKAQSSSYSIQIEESIPAAVFFNGEPVLLNLPPGPVNVIFRCLRKL